MGLSGRKQKQRIGNDPRNLSWADDASRFGSTYLAKLGWDASQGLGVSGEGRLSALKVTQKLDMLGIGAAQQRDPNGLAWKQNKDFESVLRRLNEAQAKETEGEGNAGTKRKKDDEEEAEEPKKKKKSKKKQEALEEETKPTEEEEEKPKTPYVPRVKAHRARNVASKNLASKSASAIAEILGVAPTSSSSTLASTSTSTSGTLTPISDEPETIEKLTTSTKSVADYFKERLAAKSGPATPTLVESDATPRGGIGSSKLKIDNGAIEESERLGVSMFSSLKSSSFLAVASTLVLSGEADTNENTSGVKEKKKKTDKEGEHVEYEESKEERKRAKALRKAQKEERRKQKEAAASS